MPDLISGKAEKKPIFKRRFVNREKILDPYCELTHFENTDTVSGLQGLPLAGARDTIVNKRTRLR